MTLPFFSAASAASAAFRGVRRRGRWRRGGASSSARTSSPPSSPTSPPRRQPQGNESKRTALPIDLTSFGDTFTVQTILKGIINIILERTCTYNRQLDSSYDAVGLAVVCILSYLIMYDEFQVGREHGREGMSKSLLASTGLAVAVGSDCLMNNLFWHLSTQKLPGPCGPMDHNGVPPKAKKTPL